MSQESHSQDNSLSIETQERIAEQLIRFSKALKQGEQPSIEVFLEGFTGPERAELLRELMLQELEHRSQAGELVSFEEFRERFPNDRDALKEAEQRFRLELTRLDPNQDPPEPGERLHYLGDYELLEEIGRGGMGVVYKALQLSLGKRPVAVKMLLNNQFATEEEITRFEREAKLASKPQHPNIVTVYEVGRHEGRPYFSMDFVEGQSLAAMVREHPLPPREAARYVKIAATAVHQAHEVGILHRDIKPSNILVDKDDRVRITDFGLAREVDAGQTLTETGGILGTPSYMPPEQAEGNRAKIGVCSDVYSLGAVLYELLTGRPPFAAASVLDTLHQVKTQDVIAPRVLNPKVPKDLETTCLACLEKEPSRRYGSAAELAGELDCYFRGIPIRRRPISRTERAYRWCRRKPWVALSLFLLVFTAVTSPLVAWHQYSLTTEKDGLVITLSQTVEERDGLIDKLGQSVDDKNRLIGDLNRAVKEKNGLIGELDTSLKKEQEATRKARNAVHQKRLTLYDAHMKLIERAMREPEPDLKFVHSLLDQHRPQPGEDDLRHFEWYYWWRQSHLGTSDMFLSDMKENIRKYAFSPDGRFLAAVGLNIFPMHIQLHDRKTGKKEKILEGESYALGFFRDGLGEQNLKLVAIQRKRNEPGKMVAVPTASGFRMHVFHIEKDIVVWDVKGGQQVNRVPFQVKPGEDLAEEMIFSPNGQFAVTPMTSRLEKPGRMSSIGVWDVRTGEKVQSLRPAGLKAPGLGKHRAMAFSPNGDLFAAGDDYGSIQVWSVSNWSEVTLFRPFDGMHFHGHGVASLAFKEDGTQLISGEETGEITIWDLATKEAVDTIQAHSGPVSVVSLSSTTEGSASRILSVGRVNVGKNSNAKIWDLEERKPIAQLVGHTTRIDFALLLPGGRTAVTVASDYECKTWHLDELGEYQTVAGVDMTKDGRWIVDQSSQRRTEKNSLGRTIVVNDVQIILKDRKTGKEKTLRTLKSPSRLDQIKIIEDGKMIASLVRSDGVRPELEVRSDETSVRFLVPMLPRGNREYPEFQMSLLRPSPNGRLLALKLTKIIAPPATYVAVFESKTLREIGRVKVNLVSDFQLSSDGFLYIVEKTPNTTKQRIPVRNKPPVFNSRITRYQVNTQPGGLKLLEEENLNSIQIVDWWLFPDKDLAVCERAENPALILWKLSDLCAAVPHHTPIQTFEGYTGPSMAISSDGRRLVCGGKILNVDTGQETLSLEFGSVHAFSLDDRSLITRAGLRQFGIWIGASDEDIATFEERNDKIRLMENN